MDSHVLRKAAWRLPALAGLAVLRFNTRGTAASAAPARAAFDGGVGERYDVAAAIEYAEFADLPAIWLLGWSFGTDLALRHGCDPAVAGAILLSPPLRSADRDDLAVWAALRQAGARAGARVRRLPAPGRGARSGSPPSRRPRWSACRAPSTCGSATPRRCWTRSCAGGPGAATRCRPPGPGRGSGLRLRPGADLGLRRRPPTGCRSR